MNDITQPIVFTTTRFRQIQKQTKQWAQLDCWNCNLLFALSCVVVICDVMYWHECKQLKASLFVTLLFCGVLCRIILRIPLKASRNHQVASHGYPHILTSSATFGPYRLIVPSFSVFRTANHLEFKFPSFPSAGYSRWDPDNRARMVHISRHAEHYRYQPRDQSVHPVNCLMAYELNYISVPKSRIRILQSPTTINHLYKSKDSTVQLLDAQLVSAEECTSSVTNSWCCIMFSNSHLPVHSDIPTPGNGQYWSMYALKNIKDPNHSYIHHIFIRDLCL